MTVRFSKLIITIKISQYYKADGCLLVCIIVMYNPKSIFFHGHQN